MPEREREGAGGQAKISASFFYISPPHDPLSKLTANSVRSNLRLAINHLSGPQGQRLRDDATRLHAMPQRQQHSPRWKVFVYLCLRFVARQRLHAPSTQ